MTKQDKIFPDPKKSVFAGSDTGEVEFLPKSTPDGKNAYVVTWSTVSKPRGRPTEIDWQSALLWLVAKVAKDGLPEGYGKQTIVFDWLQQWFINHELEAGRSQIMEQVRRIYTELEKIR